jgi:hypothetical protein
MKTKQLKQLLAKSSRKRDGSMDLLLSVTVKITLLFYFFEQSWFGDIQAKSHSKPGSGKNY